MGLKSLLPLPVRSLVREVLPLSHAATARRLAARARAARDARQFLLAAALYQEASALNPDNPRHRIQCGHMFKEAGDLASAEEQYERAAMDLPMDADLALQIGHLHKLAGQPALAAENYARALALSPGWREAERELAAVGGASGHAGGLTPNQAEWVIPELLPRGGEAPPAVDRNILRLFRLGGRRAHGRWGDLKVMRGIEAIRGYRLATQNFTEIRMGIDGETVRREPLRIYPQRGEGQFKYVFNLWHDFSRIAPGRHTIELDFHDALGRRLRRHQETVQVMPPGETDDYRASDAAVASVLDGTSVEESVNERPSMVRSVERTLLRGPVRTILIQRVDQLGDLVCSVPAIRRMRELFPQARLVGLMTAANVALAESLQLFDEIVSVAFMESSVEQRRVLPIEAQDRLRRTLAAYQFDLAIDLGEGDESRPLLLLSGARFLYGFKDRLSPWLDAGLEFNGHDPVNGIEIVPPSRKILLLVEALGLMAHEQAKPLTNPDRDGLSQMGLAKGERYVVIHAGARLAYTRWPHVADLVRLLLERTDLKIVLFAEDMATAESLGAEGGNAARVHVLTGQLPFAQFDALLSHCAVFVGNDSGPKHLAALRGAPVVSLHMARLNWSEWGQEMTGRIISRRVPCAGCGIGLDAEDCGKDFACLRHIRPEEVFAAVQELLEAAA